MIILDTNVISAVMQIEPDALIQDWIDQQNRQSIWTTAVTVFELNMGIHLLPQGKRRHHLEKSLQILINDIFQDRILMLDFEAAWLAGEISAERRRFGRNIDIRDTFIASIAITRHATLATRNVKDFKDLKIKVVNPWETPAKQ